ncbi:uncharacterized protein VTP21DRAFT_9255 [Calcarisporiella thermophila]|uniref:uncharacterized protein n=1 Tax=Calcarisporiella thermophila TaxID=911321 RepID=UPI003743B647
MPARAKRIKTASNSPAIRDVLTRSCKRRRESDEEKYSSEMLSSMTEEESEENAGVGRMVKRVRSTREQSADLRKCLDDPQFNDLELEGIELLSRDDAQLVEQLQIAAEKCRAAIVRADRRLQAAERAAEMLCEAETKRARDDYLTRRDTLRQEIKKSIFVRVSKMRDETFSSDKEGEVSSLVRGVQRGHYVSPSGLNQREVEGDLLKIRNQPQLLPPVALRSPSPLDFTESQKTLLPPLASSSQPPPSLPSLSTLLPSLHRQNPSPQTKGPQNGSFAYYHFQPSYY